MALGTFEQDALAFLQGLPSVPSPSIPQDQTEHPTTDQFSQDALSFLTSQPDIQTQVPLGGEIGQTVALEKKVPLSKQLLNQAIDKIGGTAEAVASTATGLAAGITGIPLTIGKFISDVGPWVAGKLTGVTPPEPSQHPFQSANEFMASWQQLGTYPPKTEWGQYLTGVANSPFEAIGLITDQASKKLFPNSPEAKAAFDVTVNLVLSGLLFKYGTRLVKGQPIFGSEIKAEFQGKDLPPQVQESINAIPDKKPFVASPDERQTIIASEQAPKVAPPTGDFGQEALKFVEDLPDQTKGIPEAKPDIHAIDSQLRDLSTQPQTAEIAAQMKTLVEQKATIEKPTEQVIPPTEVPAQTALDIKDASQEQLIDALSSKIKGEQIKPAVAPTEPNIIKVYAKGNFLRIPNKTEGAIDLNTKARADGYDGIYNDHEVVVFDNKSLVPAVDTSLNKTEYLLDKSGEPLSLYHGTEKRIAHGELKPSEDGSIGPGIYLTNNPKQAAEWPKIAGGKYLTAEQPKPVEPKPPVEVKPPEPIVPPETKPIEPIPVEKPPIKPSAFDENRFAKMQVELGVDPNIRSDMFLDARKNLKSNKPGDMKAFILDRKGYAYKKGMFKSDITTGQAGIITEETATKKAAPLVEGAEVAQGVEPTMSPEEALIKKERDARLAEQVATLSEQQQAVLDGKYNSIKPKTDAEIAKEFGVSQQRVSTIHKEALLKLKAKLTGNEFEIKSKELADKMTKDIGPAAPGKAGLSVEMTHPVPVAGEKFAFPAETEARYQAAKSIPETPGIEKAKQFLVDVKHDITRTYQHLPVTGEFIEAKQGLKNLEKQPAIIKDRLARTYKSIVYKMDVEQWDLLNRKAIVADLLREADKGHKLPFGFDEKSLRDVASKLDDFTKDNAIVNDAFKARNELWSSLRDEYIYWRDKVGHNVDDALGNEDYFRHKVIEYAQEKERSMGQGKKLKLHTGQEFLKKRAGSEKDILSDLMLADTEVMSRMMYDIREAQTLDRIRKYNDLGPKLKAEAKKQGVPLEEVIPEGVVPWQPKEGHLSYLADTVPAKIAEKILTDQITDVGVVKDSLRQSLAVGRERQTWYIKKELADTLDNLSQHKERSLLGGGFKATLTKWKQWTLLSPRRFVKYNLRNLSGDADKAFVGNPHGFTKAPQAFKELWQVYFGDRPLVGEAKEFADRGGLQTTLQVQEMGEIKNLPIFKNIYKESTLGNVNIFKKYWNGVNKVTNFRESILRYANYIDYLGQMKSNPEGKPKNFGASLPEEIMGLHDIRDRAFRLSNELLGAYDEISPMGQSMRENFYPFWSWKELNTKSYFRLMKNLVTNDDATYKTGKSILGDKIRTGAVLGKRTVMGVGKFAIRAFALSGVLAAYNNFFFSDEEKDLPQEVKDKPHIIFGRDKDGKVNYFSRLGALGDFLEVFGLDSGYKNTTDFLNGKKTIGEIAVDMLKSPINVVAGGVSPFLKTPIEMLTRKALFPDAFNPKTIRDRGAYMARNLSLEDEYRAIAGKPGRPYLSTLSQIATYKSDPLETSYYNALDTKRDYLKSIGKGGGGAFLSPSSMALYNIKLSYRYGETGNVKKYLKEYTDIITLQNKGANKYKIESLVKKGIATSFLLLDPLSGIKKADRKAYVNSLDPDEKDTLAKAMRFYNEVLLGKSKIDIKNLIDEELE